MNLPSISTLLFDFSGVLLFAKDPNYHGTLNQLHQNLSQSKDYNFFDHFQLNQELLNYLNNIKNLMPLYIFTTGDIQNTPEIRQKIDPIFTRIFSSLDLTLLKSDPQAYLKISQEITHPPEKILFIDDRQSFLDAA
jgi:FMN phosphatase YigB (HAD superfamily)